MHFPKGITILFLSALCIKQTALAQAPGMHWQKCLGGTGYDQVTGIAQADDDGYALSIGSFDFKAMKLHPDGSIEWQKTYGGSAEDIAYSIKTIPDHGYIVVGYTKSTNGDVVDNHGGSDMWVMRLNIFGDILWKKCYGGTGDEQGRYVSVDPKGGYILAGLTTSYDGDVVGRKVKTTDPDCDVWVVKLDDTGRIVWQKTFGGSASDAANCIRCTKDGGYILSGDTYSGDGDVTRFHYSSEATCDAWVIRLNPAGDTLWEKAYGGSANDIGTSIQQTSDGGFILGGITSSIDGDVKGNNGDDDGWVVKLTNLGNIDWQKCIGGNNGDGIYDIDVTYDDWYIAAGVEGSTNVKGNHGGYDFFITKMVDKGNVLWQKCLGGTNHDYGSCMTQTRDKGFIMGGWTMSNDGDVSGNHGGHYDTWVVKLEPDTVKAPVVGIPGVNEVNEIAIAPNPSTGIFSIQTPFSTGTLRIYNYLGALSYSSSITGATSHIDITTLPQGIYTIQVTNNDHTISSKLVKY